MKKIMCVLAAAAMMSFCFVGCGNDNNNKNSAVENASKAVSDVGSQIATVASDVVGDGTVSDTDGIIGNEEDKTSANGNAANGDNDNRNATDNTNENDNQNNMSDADDELL